MALIDLRLRDALSKFLPVWLANRVRAGLTVGYRFVWALIAPLDSVLDMAYQGLIARHPGLGTPTALPLIGRSRGILRGQAESQEDYAARLRKYLDTWADDVASDEFIVTVIHEYLESHPKVTIITRGEVIDGVLQPSLWTSISAAGEITQTTALWNWDTVSHPERSDEVEPWWSDEWIIVQPSQWEVRPGTLGDLGGDDGFALGHMATRTEVDELFSLLALKGAHACFRAVIFTTDSALFDPTNQATCPNGNWGEWNSYDVSGNSVPSDRNTTTCRYWEPR
jgi:hypothetical protein